MNIEEPKTLSNTVYVVDLNLGKNDSDPDVDNNDNNKRRKTTNGRVKWVGGQDDTSSVSRVIVGAAMEDAVKGFPVTLHAKYDKNVNTTLKACASGLARCANEYDKHAAMELTFRENRNELTITCRLLADPSAPCLDDDGMEENNLTVSKTTEYKTLAGAIAGRVRESPAGTLVRISAVGRECVFIAARAIATCAQYLNSDDKNEDDENLTLVAVPHFKKVKLGKREDFTNVMEICVFQAETVEEEEGG
mmetsp:Transcript_24741/g.36275  ORF Transcript_24741/g.36275 Transcript_24741/m.36275 type:complete len:249 (+) Transcript_24741:154-900(+)|eukprot:CAMPEP_0195519394 /NCGR_PEP_ID=MMETSP0794_2-20130614/14669_1 /TAXON_ID=515487 /ORGANISM="Stephanopyxis turris, Strain CCMP 815" /LENGTH=248 /DNA_ID=CAMNT_0040648533 /DNA_START=153 /DNA_END=902 /DNA_ORIENTATION=+